LYIQKREIKCEIYELEIKVDQKKRLKNLPEYLHDLYVKTGRLTLYYAEPAAINAHIVVELDGKHEARNFDGIFFTAPYELVELLQNVAKRDENADWWNSILSNIISDPEKTKYRASPDHVALEFLAYWRHPRRYSHFKN
jgi:hypothetical protein